MEGIWTGATPFRPESLQPTRKDCAKFWKKRLQKTWTALDYVLKFPAVYFGHDSRIGTLYANCVQMGMSEN